MKSSRGRDFTMKYKGPEAGYCWVCLKHQQGQCSIPLMPGKKGPCPQSLLQKPCISQTHTHTKDTDMDASITQKLVVCSGYHTTCNFKELPS